MFTVCMFVCLYVYCLYVCMFVYLTPPSPDQVPLVVSAGIYCGAKASEYGAWLLKEFSLFEYDDDDDDDD